jgi:hypothetical protein
MTRSCTDVGVCQARRECDAGCDVFYTHVPVRGPSLDPQYPFSPGTIEGYKKRNAGHLVKWVVRVVAILLALAFFSGVARSCAHELADTSPKQANKVTT